MPSASDRQRVLLHAFPSFEVGGSQMRFAQLANHFGPRYRHLIVAMNGDTACVGRLGSETPFQMLDVVLEKGPLLANTRRLRRVLRTLRPDVLVTYNWGSIEWSAANLLPICRHVHIEDGFGSEEAGRQLRRRIWTRRLLLSPWARVVLPSRQLVRIAEQTWRLPRRHLTYLPNGIDCARFSRPPDPELCATLRRHPDEALIGTVAGLRPEKNIGRLIEAFATVRSTRPARLIIVGDGGERDRLQARVTKLGMTEDVLFLGALNAPERLLGALDVFALSSDTEQMPYSVLEAMAAGLAVASVDVGDIREMLSPENRHQVVGREALAAAIRELLDHPERRAVIGAANRIRVRAIYDQEEMFARYAALFG